MEDRCVCCGEIIPEGQMVCPNCLVYVKEDKMEENRTASLNYEGEYYRIKEEFEKLREENFYLHEEVKLREEEMRWHYGFKSACELIFGGAGNGK